MFATPALAVIDPFAFFQFGFNGLHTKLFADNSENPRNESTSTWLMMHGLNVGSLHLYLGLQAWREGHKRDAVALYALAATFYLITVAGGFFYHAASKDEVNLVIDMFMAITSSVMVFMGYFAIQDTFKLKENHGKVHTTGHSEESFWKNGRSHYARNIAQYAYAGGFGLAFLALLLGSEDGAKRFNSKGLIATGFICCLGISSNLYAAYAEVCESNAATRTKMVN